MIFEDTNYEKNGFVTLEVAKFRGAIVSNCSYDVTLALPKGKNYFGYAVANFNLSEVPTKPFFLDFRGVKIGKLNVNGQEVKDNTFSDHHIKLPSSYLVVGPNVVSMNIFNKYRKDGVGLHSFTDATDGEQYIYTQYEADFCHYVMPCFD